MTSTAYKTAWHAVNISERHNGQIVMPIVEYRYAGSGRYTVRYCRRDASLPVGQQQSEWTEATGDYWAVQQHLKSEGIFTDDNRF